MSLTISMIRGARAGERAYKLADEKGLYLFVTPRGTKSWRQKYRFGGKEKVLTHGQFPDVSLADARERRDAARALLDQGRDPAVEARRRKMMAAIPAQTTFAAAALAWHEDQQTRWSTVQAALVLRALQRDVLPAIGDFPIVDINTPVVLHVLRKVEARGSIETAKRIRGYISGVFGRVIAEGVVVSDPAAGVGRALKPTPSGAKQPALISLPDLHELQRVIAASTAGPVVKIASSLLALTAVRVGVLRAALWSEINGVDWTQPDTPAPDALWCIPAERMKLGMTEKRDTAFDLDVPLPAQAVEVLRALYLLTGRGRLLFPNDRSAREPMSDAAISTLYKRMDGDRYKGRHVPHGWRSAFSTLMNEWAMEHGREGDRLIIDLMLAHRPKGVSGSEFAYMRAKFAKRRRELADMWAGMIDEGFAETLIMPLSAAPEEIDLGNPIAIRTSPPRGVDAAPRPKPLPPLRRPLRRPALLSSSIRRA